MPDLLGSFAIFWYIAEGADNVSNPIRLVPKQPAIATDITIDFSFFCVFNLALDKSSSAKAVPLT